MCACVCWFLGLVLFFFRGFAPFVRSFVRSFGFVRSIWRSSFASLVCWSSCSRCRPLAVSLTRLLLRETRCSFKRAVRRGFARGGVRAPCFRVVACLCPVSLCARAKCSVASSCLLNVTLTLFGRGDVRADASPLLKYCSRGQTFRSCFSTK